MDIHADLVELSTRNIQKADGDLLLLQNSSSNSKESLPSIVSLKVGNGWQGWPEHAPFDAIHVGAAAATFPVALAQQLRLHGVLIVPVGPTAGVQTLLRVERIADGNDSDSKTTTATPSSMMMSTSPFRPEDFSMTELLGVRYVPLVQGPES
jgi:protein-L-isoaspartate(D-aspartate) O-methyltransferase